MTLATTAATPTTLAAPEPYLMAWRLADRKVLVVGGGDIGEAKIETLLPTGARLIVVGPTITPRLADLVGTGRLVWRQRKFRRTDPRGCALVFAATDDGPTNICIVGWARRWRAVANAVDDAQNCDAIVPATIRRGPATIGITTNGASPAGARFVRETVEAALPSHLGSLLTEGARARHELRTSGRYRYDYLAWRQRFYEPGLTAARSGRHRSIEELGKRFTQSFDQTAPVGRGHLTLVGAGPGGRGLVTVAGAEALAQADVIFYDRLVDHEVLAMAPVAVRRIPVGKAKGSGVSQSEINRLLIEEASTGNRVVRLKGGDPMVFGRGVEELEAARTAGIEVDIIPGISSALAGPALAGVGVTHRGIAASFTVISGHRVKDCSHNWDALAHGSETLVVLMGASTAAEIAQRLIRAGRPANDPVLVCHRVGQAIQETARLTLEELAHRGCPFGAPSVITIGPVVSPGAAADELDLTLVSARG